ncbi:MAG: hypothetical protein ABH870_02135 [bacterium]
MSNIKNLDKQRRWRARNPNYQNEWVKKNHDKWRSYIRDKRKQLRIEVLSFYSNGTMECACCGEKQIEFLCIDHINGGGREEKRGEKRKQRGIYEYLKAQKFPLGYRVLCHNCNMSLGFYGYCPHQKQ